MFFSIALIYTHFACSFVYYLAPSARIWAPWKQVFFVYSVLPSATKSQNNTWHECTCMLNLFHCVQLFVTPWTVAHQALPSMGFPRQEYWSGLPCPPPGELPDPRIKLSLLCLLYWQTGSLPLSHLGSLIPGMWWTLNILINMHPKMIRMVSAYSMYSLLNEC